MTLRTLIDIFEERVSARGDALAVRHHDGEAWRQVSWSDWWKSVELLAAGLIDLGVERGDRVALVSETRMEWLIADMAILMVGAISVPIHPDTLARQMQLILQDAGAAWVIAEDPIQLEKLVSIREAVPDVRGVVWLEPAAVPDPDAVEAPPVLSAQQVLRDVREGWAHDISAVRERGAGLLRNDINSLLVRRRRVQPDDIATLAYTSGATGRPRGVMLTHRNFVAAGVAYANAFPIGDGDVQLLLLPLTHVFGRVLYIAAISTGCTTALSRGVAHAFAEFGEVRPTFFASVPRLFELAYTTLTRPAESGAGVRAAVTRKAIEWAHRRAEAEFGGPPLGIAEQIQGAVIDRMGLERVRALFGGRVRYAACGGASMSEDLTRFYRGAGLSVLEGYGLTESCAAACANRPGNVLPGTVGPPLPGVEVRLADDGEILIRGPNVMKGYWRDEAATAGAFRDGWLATGDIGEVVDGRFRVVDRKKDVFTMASGRIVQPLKIETLLQAIPVVARAVVHGDGRPYLSALLTIERTFAMEWAAGQGIANADYGELCRHPSLFEYVRSQIEAANRRLPAMEQIRRFAILDEEFRHRSGELTATWILRRRFVTQKYRGVLDSFYADTTG